MRSSPPTWDSSLGRAFGGAFFALVCLTAIVTVVLGSLAWLLTRGFFLVLS